MSDVDMAAVNAWTRETYQCVCKWESSEVLSTPQPCECCGETVVLLRRVADGETAWCVLAGLFDDDGKVKLGTRRHECGQRPDVDLAAMVEAVR